METQRPRSRVICAAYLGWPCVRVLPNPRLPSGCPLVPGVANVPVRGRGWVCRHSLPQLFADGARPPLRGRGGPPAAYWQAVVDGVKAAHCVAVGDGEYCTAPAAAAAAYRGAQLCVLVAALNRVIRLQQDHRTANA